MGAGVRARPAGAVALPGELPGGERGQSPRELARRATSAESPAEQGVRSTPCVSVCIHYQQERAALLLRFLKGGQE